MARIPDIINVNPYIRLILVPRFTRIDDEHMSTIPKAFRASNNHGTA